MNFDKTCWVISFAFYIKEKSFVDNSKLGDFIVLNFKH